MHAIFCRVFVLFSLLWVGHLRTWLGLFRRDVRNLDIRDLPKEYLLRFEVPFLLEF